MRRRVIQLAGVLLGIFGLGLLVVAALGDRALQRELPGYADYATRVRYRLVPRTW